MRCGTLLRYSPTNATMKPLWLVSSTQRRYSFYRVSLYSLSCWHSLSSISLLSSPTLRYSCRYYSTPLKPIHPMDNTNNNNNNNNNKKEHADPAAGGSHQPLDAAQQRALQAEISALRDALAEKEALLSTVHTGESGGGALSKKSKKKSQANRIETEPVQGTRDFPPEEMRLRQYLFGAFHEVARRFGFDEYDAPVLESEELYIRKAGEEITEQMYNFVTKGGHRVTLRPEMTPTLARLLLAKGRSLLLPVKWYAIPQCWRYEAITRGRRREHYQWNMDVIGVTSITAEVELVSACCAAMEMLGLTAKDVGIKVNSRKVLQTVLTQAGVSDEQFAPVCVIVDKMEKLPREEVEAQLAALQLSPAVIDTITSTLSIKSVDEIAARIGADHPAVKELQDFFRLITAYGYGDWVMFDANVVRGLAYYTGVVFEGFDRAGKFRAICGGGRYDHLMTLYGSPKPVPCAGFGFGDCVIVELLKEKKLLPQLPPVVDDVVIPFDESMRPAALEVMKCLRDAGRRVDMILEKKKVAASFDYANRVGADRAVLVAPDEWARGEVQVKMMREGGGGSAAGAAATENKNRGFSIQMSTLREAAAEALKKKEVAGASA